MPKCLRLVCSAEGPYTRKWFLPRAVLRKQRNADSVKLMLDQFYFSMARLGRVHLTKQIKTYLIVIHNKLDLNTLRMRLMRNNGLEKSLDEV